MDIPAFRTAFPEFANTTVYPTTTIEFYAEIAELMVLECVWKRMYSKGVNLYVAHELVLASQNQKAASVGGSPGQQGGIANTKTVGSVTVGYDASTTTEKDAGWWNLTNYGKQFYRLAMIFGAGCIQL